MTGLLGERHVYADIAALNRAAADYWVRLARQAIAARASFHVALAGGSTPRALYALLATPAYREAFDWGAAHVYFGDERGVPPDHPDSNYGMAREALLRHVPVPAAQIHRMEAERDDPAAAARDYELLLRRHLPLAATGGLPCFDLVLLGLGADGHVASLFPGTPILEERVALTAAVRVEKLQAWRLSLTYPVINAARHVALLVAGASKAPIVGAVLGGHRTTGSARYPVEGVRPVGALDWFLDREAAADLPRAGA